MPDGTIWSHAATLGTFEKGGTFELDADTIAAFVANFRAGYPSKVPVDYDHGSTSGIADGSRRVPKAGDVCELCAVLSDDDMVPDIRAQVDAYMAKRLSLGMRNSPPSPFGLWARWVPTTKALSMVKDREYTEMSIAFDVESTDNRGVEQGPTIFAIALTNTPFLDNMIPVAASRGRRATDGLIDGGTGADSPKEIHTMASKLATAFSAFLGKPVDTDDEMVTELNQLREKDRTRNTEVTQLTEFRSVIGAEFDNETDAAKVLTKVKELKAQNAALTVSATEAKKGGVAAITEGIIVKHERKLSVPARAMFSRQLSAELESGGKAGETETEKVLGSMPEIKAITGSQEAAADTGANAGATEQFESKRAELYLTDPDIVEMAKKKPNDAYALSITKAQHALANAK